MDSRYANLGVSSKKEDVSSAVKNLSGGVFPGAFCKAIENPFPWFNTPSKKEDYLYLSHADGTGTKSALAYLYWKETGDLSVFADLMQDAMVMNTDDLLCVGVKDYFYFSSTIGRNKHCIPGEVVKALIEGQQAKIAWLQEMGVKAENMGGETADIGDVVRTLSVDMTATTFIPRSEFIDTSKIKPDQIIVGLSSSGKSTYETEYNSGMGSNGLTLARHEILHSDYVEKYPETFDNKNTTLAYQGKAKVGDELVDDEGNILTTMGKALLSPTRTYLPILRKIFSEKIPINALIHNTGGGLTKSAKFGKNINFVKNNLFAFPPLFKELAKTVSLEEMLMVFNCGQRMEIYLEEKEAAGVIEISRSFGVDAQIIGYTEHSERSENQLILTTQGKIFNY